MKRSVSFILMAFMALSLSACGQDSSEPRQGTQAPPMLTAAPIQTAAESPKPEDADSANPLRAQAEELIGKDAALLIETLGEPLSFSYAPSCLGSGEDGEYIYEDFAVYTYKEGDTETVRSVE